MITPYQLFDQSLDWLRQSYPTFRFYVERDLVWTVQTRLVQQIERLCLPYQVFNDYAMLPGVHRSLSADLVIVAAVGSFGKTVSGFYAQMHKAYEAPEFLCNPSGNFSSLMHAEHSYKGSG
jgi:hypothetical protein